MDPTSALHRLVLLASAEDSAGSHFTVGSAGSVSASGQSSARSHQLDETAVKQVADFGGELVDYDLTLGYEHCSMDQVLKQLLPSTLEQYPCSFEIVGHLAHLNLRKEVEPFKFLIGQVLLDKNPSITTVVNKTGAIDSVFRTFPMELLAGKPSTVVNVRHLNCRFRFDFAHVYWNTRLSAEHERVVSRVIPPGSVVADMFCGVGPFAIPLAAGARRCKVHANDLNPRSYAAMVDNSARNGVSGSVVPYNSDAREFVARLAAARIPFQYAIMNLPADAISFLDAFVGIFAPGCSHTANDHRLHPAVATETEAPMTSAACVAASQSSRPLPVILCYAFCKTHTFEDAVTDATRRILVRLQLLGADDLPFQPPCYDTVGAAALALRGAAAACSSSATPPAPGVPAAIDSELSSSLALKPRSAAARLAVPASQLQEWQAQRAAIAAFAARALPDLRVHEVRNVAPNKTMICAQFSLPAQVAYAASPRDYAAAASAVAAALASDVGTECGACASKKAPRSADLGDAGLAPSAKRGRRDSDDDSA